MRSRADEVYLFCSIYDCDCFGMFFFFFGFLNLQLWTSWSYHRRLPVGWEPNLVRFIIRCALTTSYNCGQQGHVSVDCTNQPVPKTCFRCNEAGHVSRECPHAEARGDAAGGECYRCGETGHIARMCPVSGGSGAPRNPRACYNCGGVGHLSRDCSSAPGAAATASMKCYNCGNMGHLSRECPRPSQRSCYTCGSSDHLAAQCPQAAV